MMKVEAILYALELSALVIVCAYGLGAGIEAAFCAISKAIHHTTASALSISPPEDQPWSLNDDAWTTSNPIVYDPDNLR